MFEFDLSPLCNTNTLLNILMIIGRNVKQDEMTTLAVVWGQDFFFKLTFSGIPSVSNSLDPDQAQHFVGPDLGQKSSLAGRVKYKSM